jgi:hypothetical protein
MLRIQRVPEWPVAAMQPREWPLAKLLSILDDATARDIGTSIAHAPAPRHVARVPERMQGTQAAKCDLYARKAICHLRRADEHMRSRDRSRGRRAAASHHARAREYANKAVCIRCGERETVKYLQR